MVKTKIQSYSARDLANNHVLSQLDNNIDNNIDPFFRGTLTPVNIDNTYPNYVLNNLDKFKHMIK
jgi:hypothetical protein